MTSISKSRIWLGSAFLSLVSSLWVAVPVGASPQEEICKGSGGTWNGSTQTCTNPNAGGSLFGKGSLFENIINVMLFVVGAIAVIMIIIGGIRYIVSAGDSNAVQGAKNTIMYAIIGLIVAVLAYALVNFVLSSF